MKVADKCRNLPFNCRVMKKYPSQAKNSRPSMVQESDVMSILYSSRTGVSFSNFLKMIHNIPFTLNEWAKMLNLSERTIQRYKKEKKSFDSIYSDRIYQVVLVYQRGEFVFGNTSNFNSWMSLPCIALDGHAPKDLLDTSFGIQMVNDELTRIEHGITA